MKLHYRNALFRELRDALVNGLPKEERMGPVERAEQLLAELKDSSAQPYEYYHYRIMKQQPAHDVTTQIPPEEARHDVSKLVEDVWDSADVPIESVPERVLSIEELTRMFNVSAKTISRWRERGLVGRRYVVGSRKQLGFPQSSVDLFVRQNAERVRRGSKFSQLTAAEKHEIVELARGLATGSESAKSVVKRVAARTGRSIETVRYTIKRYDEQHPDRAVLTPTALPREERDERIYTAYRSGVSIPTLARRFQCEQTQVRRILDERRRVRLLDLPLLYMASAEFDQEAADAVILAPTPAAEQRPKKVRAPSDLPAYLASLYDVPLLTPEQELHLFRKYNYLKYKASCLRDRLDAARPSSRVMAEVERLYNEAVSVKNQIIQANLRLVVSVAKKYVTSDITLFELISDGNISLMKAVEKFDYGLGNKFSTYATWAIKKNFARTFSTHLRRQERFRTSQDELLSSEPGHRADPLEHESAQAQYESAISSILKRLNERERSVISRRYGLMAGSEPRTLKEVGEEFGVSKERIRQIEARAIDKLREAAREEHVELQA
jgi:RNA polymerase primary sigma factor/RNA polymerase sigma factor